MKTFKLMKSLYVATYLGIIAFSIFKIAGKIRGCQRGKRDNPRPLFESVDKANKADHMMDIRGGANAFYSSIRMLTPENSGYRNKELNIFVGEPNIGKRLAEEAMNPSKEVTLARHKELDARLKEFAEMDKAKRIAGDIANV